MSIVRMSDIEEKILEIVSNKTGYPPDMLELDLDMEADLGIDTVKQVELFGAIREEYDLEQDEGVNLSDYPTIRAVVDYMAGRLGIAVVPGTDDGVVEKGQCPCEGPLKGDIEEKVLEIVAEKTGYPPEMLEPDLDMEADLGIDTVKQVELFAAIREEYRLEQDEGINLAEYPTIKSVVDYIGDRVGAVEGTSEPAVILEEKKEDDADTRVVEKEVKKAEEPVISPKISELLVEQLPDYSNSQYEPIAITGIGCVFPN